MRALRFDRYGPPEVLRVEEIPEPAPRAGEVKVRVRAAGLNPLDWKIRDGHLRWVPVFRGPPRGIGCDFAGEIVGSGGGPISRYVGERVFGTVSPFLRDGALAEYLVVPAADVVPIPAGIDFEHAAALPVAGGTALQALEDEARVVAGQRVLITGAAGGVGHLAVQVARHLGAHVTGVAGAANADFVRELGADAVIDYAREDFTRRAGRYDVVFDAAGASSFGAARRVLARAASRQRAIPFALKAGAALWDRLARLAASGVLRVHVARTLPLEEVAEAQRAMATGHGRGKLVVVP